MLAALLLTILASDPELRLARLEAVREFRPESRRIFVSIGPEGRAVELTGDVREDFLALLRRPETYSDVPGVIGCIAQELVITTVSAEGVTESWFCTGCQRIYPRIAENGFDAVLSEEGARAVRKTLLRAFTNGSRVASCK